MQLIYRLRLAAKKVEGDRDFQAQMKEEPMLSLFQIPVLLTTLKEEKKEPNPEDEIVSIVENSVLEMEEEEEKKRKKKEKEKEEEEKEAKEKEAKEKEKEKEKEKKDEQPEEKLSVIPVEATFSTIPKADLSEEWW